MRSPPVSFVGIVNQNHCAIVLQIALGGRRPQRLVGRLLAAETRRPAPPPAAPVAPYLSPSPSPTPSLCGGRVGPEDGCPAQKRRLCLRLRLQPARPPPRLSGPHCEPVEAQAQPSGQHHHQDGRPEGLLDAHGAARRVDQEEGQEER